MHISEYYTGEEPVFSFEFFPPANDKAHVRLLKTISELQALQPHFVSVTYGAGGSTRDRTLELVSWIKNTLGLEAMAHLTCVGSSRDELRARTRESRTSSPSGATRRPVTASSNRQRTD